MDFFSESFDFNLSAEEFFKIPEKPKKPEKPKEDTSKKDKASAGKENVGKDCNVSLPVTVIGRNIQHVVEGTGTIKLSELHNKLVEQGYDQLKLSKQGLVYEAALNVVYVVEMIMSAVSNDSCVNLSDNKTVVVADGMLKAEFSAEHFENLEPDEITISAIAEKFAEINSQYKDCGLYYEESCGVAYPVLKRAKDEKLDDVDVVINVNGSQNTYGENDAETLYELVKKLTGETGAVKCYLAEGNDMYTLVYEAGKAKPYGVVADKSGKPLKKVEEKYPLPFELYITTWGERMMLEPTMFNGKNKVTKSDITSYMATVDKMFSDKARKPEYFYFEEKKLMSVGFTSGTKGAFLCE